MAEPKPDPRQLRPAPIHRVTNPIRRFLRVEAASGAVLFLCSILALVLANMPSVADHVHHFWETHVGVAVSDWKLDKPLHFWVNDGLMVIFFFVVGLEIKRELMTGELRTVRQAALPVVAALGGMLVPAGLYLLLGRTDNPLSERGWGIPMATDIAFVVGVMAAFGRRVPIGLKVFLLSLAIADDMGAVVVIAVAYTDQLNLLMLGLAGGGLATCVVLNRLGVRPVVVYVIVGTLTWVAMYESNVHPTIAGVLLGLLTPHYPWLNKDALRLALQDTTARVDHKPDDMHMGPGDVAVVQYASREVVPPLNRLEDLLHPWVAFAIMPIFALANAGVVVNPQTLTDAVSIAVAVGLFVGKPIGVVLFSWAAVKAGWASLPNGVTWRMMIAAGFLAGIGFTMSLFIGELAFRDDRVLLADAKTGILTGSLLAAVVGASLLWWSTRGAGKPDEEKANGTGTIELPTPEKPSDPAAQPPA